MPPLWGGVRHDIVGYKHIVPLGQVGMHVEINVHLLQSCSLVNHLIVLVRMMAEVVCIGLQDFWRVSDQVFGSRLSLISNIPGKLIRGHANPFLK